jgi:hypothetical protein
MFVLRQQPPPPVCLYDLIGAGSIPAVKPIRRQSASVIRDAELLHTKRTFTACDKLKRLGE